MTEDEKKMQERSAKFLPFSLLAMIFLLTFLPFFISSQLEDAPWGDSFGIDAFLQATFFLEFSAIAALGALFALFFVGKLKQAPIASPIQKEALPFAFAEFPVLMGFVLAFINENAYLVLPFSAFSLALWVYFYTRKED